MYFGNFLPMQLLMKGFSSQHEKHTLEFRLFHNKYKLQYAYVFVYTIKIKATMSTSYIK